VPQEIGVKVVSVSTWTMIVCTDWEVVPRVESGDVQSEVSKRGPVVDIHDRRGISEAGRPMCLRCCCKSHVACESMHVLAGERLAHQRLATRHQGCCNNDTARCLTEGHSHHLNVKHIQVKYHTIHDIVDGGRPRSAH